jgi:polynucleotide 5'-hydroxyl-kinase GRC3/NOL9
VLDTDVGQSEIGPPGCVGLAFADSPVVALSDLAPVALGFVGSITPHGHLLQHTVAVRRLADLTDGRLLIIDTSGYVEPVGARALNQAEFDLVNPKHIVALQRAGELEGVLATIRRRTDCMVHTPPVPDFIAHKPTAFRRQRRALRFAAYFTDARIHRYALDEVAVAGTWLGSGKTVAPHLLKFLNQAVPPDVRVYHAEMMEKQLGMMVSADVAHDSPYLAMIHEQLKPSHIAITVAPRLRHLMVGLESGTGRLLGIGLLEELDFRRRDVGILTPSRAPAAASILRFGSLRLRPDGTEIGVLQPSDL